MFVAGGVAGRAAADVEVGAEGRLGLVACCKFRWLFGAVGLFGVLYVDGSTPDKSTFTPQYDLLRAKLRDMREAAGLTQRELAQELEREHSFVGRIETGERRVDLVEFVWICEACGQDPEEAIVDLVRRFER